MLQQGLRNEPSLADVQAHQQQHALPNLDQQLSYRHQEWAVAVLRVLRAPCNAESIAGKVAEGGREDAADEQVAPGAHLAEEVV